MPRVAAIVLAAGAGTRFGGGKLAAPLEGRPILQHVLDALASAGIKDPIVVVAPGTPEPVMRWHSASLITNPEPERGLSSSLHVGWAAALATEPLPDAVLVVLGDQPRLDPSLLRRLAAEPTDSSRPVVVARHANGSRNPVRLEPTAGPLVDEAHGDRGIGPLLEARPELVREIEALRPNPDIDTRADLVAVLEEGWAARVRENAAQVDRLREAPDGRDFYRSVSRLFVADPSRTDDRVLNALLAEARPSEAWLDIGAGAGRFALPIARRVREVIAVDPSTSMLDGLRAGMRKHEVANIRVLEGRWPPDEALRAALGPDPVADVSLIAQVGYDIEAIGPFLDAMEAATRRRCVAVLMDRSPATLASPFWPPVHGEARVPLPARGELVELLRARGRDVEVSELDVERRRWADRDEALTLLRRQLWTRPGSAKDDRLVELLDEQLRSQPDGGVGLPDVPPLSIGFVTWAPR